MSIAVKRILLVTRNVQFAIDIKRALESLGEYEVSPVSEARNAIEHLRRRPQHLVLLDVEGLSVAPSGMIDMIRGRQDDIAIVLGPDRPESRELAREFGLQGVVDIPAASRALLPILEGALREVHESLPQTVRLSAVDAGEDTVNIETLVDGLAGEEAMPSYTLQKLQASYRLLHPEGGGSSAGEETVEGQMMAGGLDDAASDFDESTAHAEVEGNGEGDGLVPLCSRVHDAYVRRLTVAMAREMDGLTAEAAFLTRGNGLVAYSGGMSMEDFGALREAVKDDWGAERGTARLRFLTVANREEPCMVYSRGAADGLTLSMVFAGGAGMNAVKAQGDTMLGALSAVPPVDDGEAEGVDVVNGERETQPVAFVWLVADDSIALSKNVAEQMVFWLDVQLSGLGWTVRRLDAHRDFVSMLADAPRGVAADTLARELMARSESIARAEDGSLPRKLWADAYMVLQPGRDLEARELRGFLRYARAER